MTTCAAGSKADEFAGFKPACHRAAPFASVVESADRVSLPVR
jgi:hypothetical protein